MLSLDQLRLKELVLIKELELVRCQIEFVVSLKRDEHQKDIESPSSSQSKDSAIPEYTATGKETTNPLKAIILPKDKTEVQTSRTLASPLELSLRPNGGIQIPNKTIEKSIAASQEDIRVHNSKQYYVVFNGPNAGIYNTWEIAQKAVNGIPGCKHRKYKTFQEAKVAANLFTTAEMKPPLEFICSSEGLKPTYQQALKSTKNPKTVLGTLPTKRKAEETEICESKFESFNYLYTFARNAGEKTFNEDRFFTTDKKNLSTLNCYPNCDPMLCLEAFEYGLLSQIYPAKNLLEISLFSEDFRKAVKQYKSKCAGQDKEIYLKFTSSIIYWEQSYDEPVPPFHLVQIGIVKEKNYEASKSMPATLEKDDLFELTIQKLQVIVEKILSIKREDKIKVNYTSKSCIMISHFHKAMEETDWEKIMAIKQQIIAGQLFRAHHPLLCNKVKKLMEKDGESYLCDKCAGPKGKDILVPTTMKE